MDSKLHNDLRPHLERLTEKSNQVRTLALPQATADSLLHKLRIEFTHGSTAIEGNTLTLRETQLLIDEGKTPLSSKELRELHETINHDAAVGQILDLVRDNACVSEEEVRGIHRMVMKNIQG